MRKIFSYFLCAFFLFSCDGKQPASAPVKTPFKTSFSDPLIVKKQRTVNLLPEARAVVSEWLAYITAQNEIENMVNKTGSEIAGSSNNLVQIMESLRGSLPDTLQTAAVKSRTNVLVTKANILHQLANKKEKNPDEIFEVAEEVVIEFDNFKLQLNEVFLKTPENFEFELDEQFQESQEDSLQNALFDTL